MAPSQTLNGVKAEFKTDSSQRCNENADKMMENEGQAPVVDNESGSMAPERQDNAIDPLSQAKAEEKSAHDVGDSDLTSAPYTSDRQPPTSDVPLVQVASSDSHNSMSEKIDELPTHPHEVNQSETELNQLPKTRMANDWDENSHMNCQWDDNNWPPLVGGEDDCEGWSILGDTSSEWYGWEAPGW